MTTDCNCKNVTINVCGCCGHDNTGSEEGTGSGVVGEWKLLGTLSNKEDSIDLSQTNFSEIICAVSDGYWITSLYPKPLLETISQSVNPQKLILPGHHSSGTYKGMYMAFSVTDMKLQIGLYSSNYILPVYVYYR